MPRLWVPLVALLAGLLLPAGIAFGLLSVAGEPGYVDGGPALRRGLLLVLYTLMAAPVPGWGLLPLSWPLLLWLHRAGFAGLLALVLAAGGFGLASAHFVLNGDLTVESPGSIPLLVVAFGCQAAVVWACLWALSPRFSRPV